MENQEEERIAGQSSAKWIATVVAAVALLMVAASSAPAAEDRSIEEAALNPYGDPWSLAEPNPSVALAGATGCYRKPAEGMSRTLSPEELAFQRVLATPFVIEECAVIIETDPPIVNDGPGGDTAALKQRVAQFKETNPSEKFIGYYDFGRWEATPIGYRDILASHTDWFVFKKGTSKDDLKNRLRARRGNGFLLDVTNPDYQDYIAQKIADGVAYYGMDGLLADNVHSAPRLDEADEALLPRDVRAGWVEGEIAILRKIKERIGSDKYLFVNVIRDEKDAFRKRILEVVDGIMVEDGLSPVARPLDPEKGRLVGTLRAYALARKAGKIVIVTANTLVDGSKYGETSVAREQAYARYYLAAHLIFRDGEVYLLYNPPSAVQSQYGAEAFFADWNIDIGAPTGPYEEIEDGVYRRRFTNSVVYLNSSKRPFEITPPEGFELAPDGSSRAAQTLKPKSGFIFSRPEALQ
jgi:hypothetical protein